MSQRDRDARPRETRTSVDAGEFGEGDDFDRIRGPIDCLGIDSGASLVKLCASGDTGGGPGGSGGRDGDAGGEGESLRFATWLAPSQERILALVRRLSPSRIGVTGCGAAGLCRALDRDEAGFVEFEAWARGAGEMLTSAGLARAGPYLLVSVGTGTTMLRVEGERFERVGGTALGGGTARGLGFALTGTRDHRELLALAGAGERGRVDLLVGDLFEEDAAPMLAEATAACFGRIGLPHDPAEARADTQLGPRREDLAAATLGLVAENIGLIANAHAAAAGVSRIVYGGSTLHENPRIAEVVRGLGLVMGYDTIVLPRSGHVGALGAMRLAC